MEKSDFLQEKYVKLYKVIGVTAGVYLAFRYALPLFAPFVAAYLLAGAVRPVVTFLKKKLHKELTDFSFFFVQIAHEFSYFCPLKHSNPYYLSKNPSTSCKFSLIFSQKYV